ncbi:hypothetical protein ACHHYP_12036 [Achlya hypogyna]|uniref:UDP-N-acetylglucosamine-peptide N-acetylglucosaminyltransferase n=1 Tax=Achlya hypogyna TaxID=1202772 RepID=A0A1V9YHR1_ACHHY|nr:hypothetical protein ACHHYP_12036 [Achlya hypogyna]
MPDDDSLRRLSDVAKSIIKRRRSTLTRQNVANTDDDDDDDHDDHNNDNDQYFASKYHRMRHETQTMAPVERDVQAQWKWLNGKHAEAKAGLVAIASEYPTYPHVHFKLGFLHLIMHDANAAINAFTTEITALKSLPERKDEIKSKRLEDKVHLTAFLWCSYVGCEEAYTALHDEAKAQEAKDALVADGGTSLEACVAMGSLFARLGLLQRAETCFELAAVINPKDPTYLAEYATVLLLQRRPDRALSISSRCLVVAAPLSREVFCAMLSQATAYTRLRQLSKAKSVLTEVLDSLTPLVEAHMTPLLQNSEMDRATLRQLFFAAVQAEGCRALASGDLQRALDVYFRMANEYPDFQLPVVLVAPGSRDATGELLDTSYFAINGIVNVLMYLDEIEIRYGPDPCLYFHRYTTIGQHWCDAHTSANVYRALGNLRSFLHDLAALEQLQPHFMTSYLHRGSFGDYLDEDTMTWLPHRLLCAIYETAPEPPSPLRTTSLDETRVTNAAVVEYFETRLRYDPNDVYAELFMTDGLRRLEMSGQLSVLFRPAANHLLGDLSLAAVRQREAAGVSFDDTMCGLTDDVQPATSKSCAEALLTRYPTNPLCIFANFAFTVRVKHHSAHLREYADATKHFNSALDLLSGTLTAMEVAMHGRDKHHPVDAPTRWMYQSYTRAKYHAHVWRSVAHRLQLNTVDAMEDLKAAMSLLPRDPHGLVRAASFRDICEAVQLVKAMTMVHFGQPRHAITPLQTALESFRENGVGNDKAIAIDFIVRAGTSSFSLLPGELRKKMNEALALYNAPSDERAATNERNLRAQREKFATKILTIEALDTLYEAGVLKLSKGSVASAIQYFEALVHIKEAYVSTPVEALLDLQRCRDPRYIDEKLTIDITSSIKIYICHHRLSKRSIKLAKLHGMHIEAMEDMAVCLHYAPHDVDLYWRRAMLYRRYQNYEACLEDLSLAIELTLNGEVPTKLRGVRLERFKTLVLARSDVYTSLKDYQSGLEDLDTLLELHERSKDCDIAVAVSLHEKRSALLVSLRRYEQAIDWMIGGTQEMETALALSADAALSEKSILNNLLLGNLHCQVAMTSQKKHAVADHYLFPIPMCPLTSATTASLRKAAEYYDFVLTKQPDFPLAHFLRGRMHAFEGDCTGALECLDTCLRQDPGFVAAHFLRGSIRAQQCLPDLALAEFLTVRTKVPLYPGVQTSIGYCYYILGNARRAVSELTEAITQANHDATALYTRGCVLQELLALNRAIDDFTAAIALNPRFYQAYYQRGICRVLLQEYTAAIPDFKETVRLDIGMVEAYVLLGYAYYNTNQFELAREAYSLLLQERTTDGRALIYRGLCHYRLDDMDLALRDLHRAVVKIDSSLWFGYYVLAVCYHRKGDIENTAKHVALCVPFFKSVPTATTWMPTQPRWAPSAVFKHRKQCTHEALLKMAKFSCLQSKLPPEPSRSLLHGNIVQLHFSTHLALAVHPNSRQAYLRRLFRTTIRHVVFMARVVKEMEDIAYRATLLNTHLSNQLDAMAVAATINVPRGLFTDESVAWAHNLLGTMCHSYKKPEEALRNLTSAIAATPNNPIPYFNKGNVYFAMNAFPSALAEYKDALKADGDHIPSLVNAALVLRELGNEENACSDLAHAAQLLTPSTDPHTQVLVCYNYANALRQLDRPDEALDLYSRAIELSPLDIKLIHNRGSTSHSQMKFTAALQDYEAALQLDANAFETRLNRSQLYIASSRCYFAQQDLAVATRHTRRKLKWLYLA